MKPSRFLTLLGVAGLLATLLSAALSTAIVGAQPDPDPSDDGNVADIWDGTEPLLVADEGGLFFPWVGNDDESTGLGPADTSISVQNLTNAPAVAFAFVGGASDVLGSPGGWNVVGPFFLAPWASKTFTAAQLGIAEGEGAPVHVAGYNRLESACDPDEDLNEDGDCGDVEAEVTLFADDDQVDDVTVCVVLEGGDPAPYWDGTAGDAGAYVDWENIADLEERYLAGGQFGGLDNDGLCNDEEAPDATFIETAVLGGYAKQAVDGEELPYTSTADSSVSGYNAVGGVEIAEFHDWYLPIVQTNCGPGGCWDSIIRIANFGQVVDGEIGNIGAAAVTISIFAADDAQGSLDTGFQLQTLLNAGDTWTINLSDYVEDGFVGSAHIYSDSAVFAMVDRVKPGYSEWLTTTGTNAVQAQASVGNAQGNYLLFAPDVRLDFFGWNTGINVANLVNQDNNVNIQYFNNIGNAASTLTRRLAPQGMTYFYDPSQAPQDNSQQDPTQDVNADIIGSALIWSDYPVAVAVDATKYPESTTEADQNVFQAFTYNATGNVYNWQAFPLVQKGNPTTGMGATSGIQVLNPNNSVAQAVVYWVNPSGFGADNFGQSGLAIPAYANGFVYTMSAQNLPNGFYGAAVLYATYPVAAVTTQVDYQVEFDGTASWNAYNPCGYYRDAGPQDAEDDSYADCNLGDPFAQPEGGSVKKTFVDSEGEPVAGVTATIYNEVAFAQLAGEDVPGTPWTATGTSDVNGEILWTNVPEGDYWLIVDEWDEEAFDDPNDFEADNGVFYADEFTLDFGEDEVIENVLEDTDIIVAGLVKRVCLAGEESSFTLDYTPNDPVDEFEADDTFTITVNGETTEPIPVTALAADVEAALEALEGINGEGDDDDVDDVEVAGGPLADETGNAEAPLTITFGTGAFGGGSITVSVNDDAITEGIISLRGAPDSEPVEELELTGGCIPVEDALVEVLDQEGNVVASDRTDEDGVATFDDLEPGTYDVCVSRLDTAAPPYFAEQCDEDVVVTADEVTELTNFVELVILDVFVRDEDDDEPLEGATVCLWDDGDEPLECLETDDDGQVEFFNVAAGTYSLTASAPGYEVQGSGEFIYDPEVDNETGPNGMDDELGDTDDAGEQQDIQLALDPADAIFGAVNVEEAPWEGAAGTVYYEIRVYLGTPDDETAGTCNGALQAVETSLGGVAPGYVVDDLTEEQLAQFGMDNDTAYCVTSTAFDDNGTPDDFSDDTLLDDQILFAVEPGENPAGFEDNDVADDVDYEFVWTGGPIVTGPIFGVVIGPAPIGGSTLQGEPAGPRFEILLFLGDESDSVEGCNGQLQPETYTGDLGEIIEIPMENGVEYCIEVYDNTATPPDDLIHVEFGIQTDVSPPDFVTDDPAGDVDLNIPLEDGTETFVDVIVTLSGLPAADGTSVNLYPGDVATDTCDTTTPLQTLMTSGGVVSFSVPAGGDFCAGADPNGDMSETTDGPVTVPDGDPSGDGDLTIAETTPL